MVDQEKFFAQFKFNPQKSGLVGVEREQFVYSPHVGKIVPESPRYIEKLEDIKKSGRAHGLDFGYELSACQIESKIGPCELDVLKVWLSNSEALLSRVDATLGLARLDMEVAPEGMPLDVYPDPTGRYQSIVKNMPQEILSAACRVAATHVHVGMPNLAEAIRAYNNAILFTHELIALGDGSGGRRMELYKVMAKRYLPEPIDGPAEFYERALDRGFINDPRTCWTLIRISIHGTVEFRMFGATHSLDQIAFWARRCHEICQ